MITSKIRAEESPCIDCEMKGCGAYHDICEKYKAYKDMIARNRKAMRQDRATREYIKQTTFKSRANENSPFRSLRS